MRRTVQTAHHDRQSLRGRAPCLFIAVAELQTDFLERPGRFASPGKRNWQIQRGIGGGQQGLQALSAQSGKHGEFAVGLLRSLSKRS